VPRFLAQLKKAYPRLELVLREGLTDELLAELRDGELDVVLAAQTFSPKGLHLYPFAFEPFWLAVPRNHVLAIRASVRPADLRTSDMVLLEDGHCLRDQVVELCPVHQRGKVRQYHAVSLETVRYLVASGAGYTLMPRLAVPLKKPGRDGLLVYRELDGKNLGRKLLLACRDQYPRMKDVRELVGFLRKWSEEEGLAIPISLKVGGHHG
jgi:LysR family hydrogen peroxide-inducible transcriptional activator